MIFSVEIVIRIHDVNYAPSNAEVIKIELSLADGL